MPFAFLIQGSDRAPVGTRSVVTSGLWLCLALGHSFHFMSVESVLAIRAVE